MIKKVKSWSKPDNDQRLIGRKCVDWSIFVYGTHIPVQFIPEFERANGDVHVARGGSQDVKLRIDGKEFDAKLINVDRKTIAIDTLQLRYDANDEMKEFFKQRFPRSYQYLAKRRAEKEAAGEGGFIKVPAAMAEYIWFYATEEPFTYELKLEVHEGSLLAYPFSKIFASLEEAQWAYGLLSDMAKVLKLTEPDDPRYSLRLKRDGQGLVFNYCAWMIMGFYPSAEGLQVRIPVVKSTASVAPEQIDFHFAQIEGEEAIGSAVVPVALVRSISAELQQNIFQALQLIEARFAKHEKTPFRKSHMELLGKALFDEGFRAQLLQTGLAPEEEDGPRVWWVNQGGSQAAEQRMGVLWAPQENKNGRSLYHWDTMTELVEGDIVLHYANGALRYVSQVQMEAEEMLPPAELNSPYAERMGNLVRVAYYPLEPMIPLQKIGQAILQLNLEQGPIDSTGSVKQGYLFRFSWPGLAVVQKAQLETEWPEFAQVEIDEEDETVEESVSIPPVLNPKYTIEDLCRETGFVEDEMARWIKAINRKGQAIVYGPPGTGKTYVAERLANYLLSETDGHRDLVQFHPAYAYEDFMQGIRPKTRPDGSLEYALIPGRFLEFCQEAESRTGRSVLIIDEINRANLARVFGELMYLLEYRERVIPLAGGGTFKIPANVVLLGTMNTADRSIALVDHALRRRFAFLALPPQYDVLKQYHSKIGFNADGLVEQLTKINRYIADPHYEIGISFFLRKDLAEQIEDIWRMEIEPCLEEYFTDQRDRVDEFRWDKMQAKVLL